MKARRWRWELPLGAETVSRLAGLSGSSRLETLYPQKMETQGMAYLDDRAITSMER